MTRSTHTIQRLAAALALALALAVLTLPVAQADTDGSLLTRASKQAASQRAGNPSVRQVSDDGTLLSRASRHAAQLQQLVKTNPGRVTDGTLLSRASRRAALEEFAKINPGHVTDGMLLTKSALLYELAQIDPGHGTGESIVSEAAATRAPTGGPVGHNGFDWGDAGTGFGFAAFAAALVAGAAFTVRRRGTLIHLPSACAGRSGRGRLRPARRLLKAAAPRSRDSSF